MGGERIDRQSLWNKSNLLWPERYSSVCCIFIIIRGLITNYWFVSNRRRRRCFRSPMHVFHLFRSQIDYSTVLGWINWFVGKHWLGLHKTQWNPTLSLCCFFFCLPWTWTFCIRILFALLILSIVILCVSQFFFALFYLVFLSITFEIRALIELLWSSEIPTIFSSDEIGWEKNVKNKQSQLHWRTNWLNHLLYTIWCSGRLRMIMLMLLV